MGHEQVARDHATAGGKTWEWRVLIPLAPPRRRASFELVFSSYDELHSISVLQNDHAVHVYDIMQVHAHMYNITKTVKHKYAAWITGTKNSINTYGLDVLERNRSDAVDCGERSSRRVLLLLLRRDVRDGSMAAVRTVIERRGDDGRRRRGTPRDDMASLSTRTDGTRRFGQAANNDRDGTGEKPRSTREVARWSGESARRTRSPGEIVTGRTRRERASGRLCV